MAVDDKDLKKVTKMLERGGTMLAKHCDCGAPLFKYQGRVVCPVCDGKKEEQQEESTRLAVPVETKPALAPHAVTPVKKEQIAELPCRPAGERGRRGQHAERAGHRGRGDRQDQRDLDAHGQRDVPRAHQDVHGNPRDVAAGAARAAHRFPLIICPTIPGLDAREPAGLVCRARARRRRGPPAIFPAIFIDCARCSRPAPQHRPYPRERRLEPALFRLRRDGHLVDLQQLLRRPLQRVLGSGLQRAFF